MWSKGEGLRASSEDGFLRMRCSVSPQAPPSRKGTQVGDGETFYSQRSASTVIWGAAPESLVGSIVDATLLKSLIWMHRWQTCSHVLTGQAPGNAGASSTCPSIERHQAGRVSAQDDTGAAGRVPST